MFEGTEPRRISAGELATASHVVSFDCDLGDVTPLGVTIDRWEDTKNNREGD